MDNEEQNNEIPVFITEAFNQHKQSIMEKIMPALDAYTLTTLKLQQLRSKGGNSQQVADLKAHIGYNIEEIQKVLSL